MLSSSSTFPILSVTYRKGEMRLNHDILVTLIWPLSVSGFQYMKASYERTRPMLLKISVIQDRSGFFWCQLVHGTCLSYSFSGLTYSYRFDVGEERIVTWFMSGQVGLEFAWQAWKYRPLHFPDKEPLTFLSNTLVVFLIVKLYLIIDFFQICAISNVF